MERLNTIIQQNDRLYDFLNKSFSKCRCRVKYKKPKKRQGKEIKPASYREDELMTIDMALSEMKVSRGTIYNLINTGKLSRLKKPGRVRLIKAEVMAAKQWYSVPKGKI